MIINHNISALNASNLLNRNDTKMSQALERLSSGLKINSAADDAAGMAISQKMRSQIRALDKSSDNALDGISAIQTAEGALSEVEACIQRMRELSVQAANETNTVEDREAIQQEIDEIIIDLVNLCERINREIDELPNYNEQLVLRYRYIDEREWKEIGEALHQSVRNIYRVHNNALKHFHVPA